MRFIYTGSDWLAYRRFRYYMHLATSARSITTMNYWLGVAKSHSIK
jgi:hypothetical protein